MTSRSLVALAFTAASCVAVVCCQQALSIDGPVKVEPNASACGIEVPVAGGCASCVTTSCCSQATACAGDPACLAMESCLLGCESDYACRSRCVSQYETPGHDDIAALDSCVAASCNDRCGLVCGVPGSYTTPDVAQDCQQCIAFSGCGATQACITDPACATAAECGYACTTPDCRAACAIEGGSPAVTTFLDAAFTVGPDCYFRCKWGQNWTCAGKAAPPHALAPGAPQSVTLSLSDNGAPVPGVSVQACGPNDGACASPLASGTSDPQGNATLTGLPAAGLYGFEGFFLLAGPTLPRTMSALSFPLSQPNAQLGLLLLSSTELAQDLADVGVTTDAASYGTILVFVQDCLQLPAPDVTVGAAGTPSPNMQALYFSGLKPTTTLTSTSVTGAMMFVNVEPGSWTLEATPIATGVVSSHATVYVAAGSLTIVTMIPASN